MRDATRDFWRMLLRCTIGMACLVIGWTGAGVLAAWILGEVAEAFRFQISKGIVMVVSVASGALVGGLPFGFLAARWAAVKWPVDSDVRTNRGR